MVVMAPMWFVGLWVAMCIILKPICDISSFSLYEMAKLSHFCVLMKNTRFFLPSFGIIFLFWDRCTQLHVNEVLLGHLDGICGAFVGHWRVEPI